MYNAPDFYRAEVAYRRERALAERRPLMTLRRGPLTRRRRDDGTAAAA